MKTKWTVKGKPTKVYDIVAYRLTADNRDGRFESKWGTLAETNMSKKRGRIKIDARCPRCGHPRGWHDKKQGCGGETLAFAVGIGFKKCGCRYFST